MALALLLGGLTWHEVLLDHKNRELAGALDGTEKQRQRNVILLPLALRVIVEHGDFADEPSPQPANRWDKSLVKISLSATGH